eukprot:Mrub_06106.p2 GENE.Mrub_06106~~Mrub_06106.p2  ORF type:complete len:121 (-),score=0.88 Mrub_06106:337-699(-)
MLIEDMTSPYEPSNPIYDIIKLMTEVHNVVISGLTFFIIFNVILVNDNSILITIPAIIPYYYYGYFINTSLLLYRKLGLDISITEKITTGIIKAYINLNFSKPMEIVIIEVQNKLRLYQL